MRHTRMVALPVWKICFGMTVLALGFGGACTRRPQIGMDFSIALSHLSRPPYADRGLDAVSDMLSSYDRTGGNRDWANLPELRIGDEDYLLADLKGPGCVKRIWTTNVRADEWRFYFDDETDPRLVLRERDLFSSRRETVFPFAPPFTGRISGGAFNYIPLPYRERLRIVIRAPYAEPDARPYYHINYETYPEGTEVVSFPETFSDAERRAVAKARTTLEYPEAAMRTIADRLKWQPVTLPTQSDTSLLTTRNRAGMIETLAFRLRTPETFDPVLRARTLRHLVLLAYWDGAASPSVEVPLGDFFCNGLHARRFAALTLANVDGAYISRFPMPFAQGARILIRNDGPIPVALDFAVERKRRAPRGFRYFHAAWQSDQSPGRPFRILRTNGRGDFMGVYLISYGMEPSWNILESDEYFLRDGGQTPVHYGTGLEDYFNGGWYYTGLFEQPLHGLLEKAAMRTGQYRLQIPDPVTFERSLEMQIQFGHANVAQGYMSAASYWYQDQPTSAGSTIPDIAHRFPELEQIGVAAIMSELFELERMGLDRELEARCRYYAARLANHPMGQMLDLRALAYRELREGAAAVRGDYARMARDPANDDAVTRQAELLFWRQHAPWRGLFGAKGHAQVKLFVNGEAIGENANPHQFEAFPATLSPGENLLQAEIESAGDHAWFALGFRADFTNVVSDASWDYSETEPAGWPRQTGDEALWRPYQRNPNFLPLMNWWQFSPNAFVLMQSGRQAGGPFADWEQPVGRRIYLRRRIRTPDDPADRMPPLSRRHNIPAVAVRPEGDTSNLMLSP